MMPNNENLTHLRDTNTTSIARLPLLVEIMDDKAKLRYKIDEEIRQLEERTLTLKSARNNLSPIAELHPELIQRIFAFAALSSKLGKVGKTSLRISWVCRLWRVIAHQSSELWSSIDFLHPEWAETAVSRTRNRPLSFSFSLLGIFKQTSQHLASLFLRNLARIKFLSICSDWAALEPDPLTQMIPLWVLHAPALVELNLTYISLPSPPNPLLSACPSLRQLSVRNCEFDWESLPLPATLQHLSITQPVNRTSGETLLSQLQSIFPNLETLKLTNTLQLTTTDEYSDSSVSKGSYRLGKITSFEIEEEEPLTAAFVLKHLALPSYVPTP